MRYFVLVLISLVLISCQFSKHEEYLSHVEAYANALLEYARDTYGMEHSPSIATTIIRENMSLPEGNSLDALLSLKRENWGIRSHDRMLTGANPMHDQNLYQVLYALTDLSGNSKYQASNAVQ